MPKIGVSNFGQASYEILHNHVLTRVLANNIIFIKNT